MTAFARPHHDWNVGRLARWRRRLVTIPLVLVAAAVLWASSPVLLVAALVADAFEPGRRHRWLRALAFALGYATLELVAIVTAFVLWIATGFGLALARPWAQEAHRRVKVWWANWILRLVRVCMSTTVTITGDDCVVPGPIVAIGRHVSMGDAVIPVIVLGKRHGFEMRYTLKKDLVHLPAIDLYGHRLPNYFVDRKPRDRDVELDPIRDLARGLGERSAGVVFPEGTFRTDERFERALARIARTDPERADRVRTLRHLLPARAGGTLAMLDGAPDADVVVITHTGFERFNSFKEILANIPFDRAIEVGVWRVPRAAIPDDEAGRLRWLDHEWQLADDWITERIEGARVDG